MIDNKENIDENLLGIEIEEVKKGRPKKVKLEESIETKTELEFLPTAEELEIKRLQDENKTKDNQLNDLKTQFGSLQNQLNLLMQNNSLYNSQKKETDDEVVTIGCNTFGVLPFCTIDERVNYIFNCGEEKDIELSEVKELLKDNSIKKNKNLFAKNLLYFADEKYYKMFKIKKEFELSTEEIVKMLQLPSPNDTIIEINRLTKNLTDYNVLQTINFKIASLLIDASVPLKKWDYKNRVTLEEYIGLKFDDIIAASGLYKAWRQRS